MHDFVAEIHGSTLSKQKINQQLMKQGIPRLRFLLVCVTRHSSLTQLAQKRTFLRFLSGLYISIAAIKISNGDL